MAISVAFEDFGRFRLSATVSIFRENEREPISYNSNLLKLYENN